MDKKTIDLLGINHRDELIKELDCPGDTELYAFFGYPADHSLSPRMHNAAFNHLGLKKKYFASGIPVDRIEEAYEKALSFDIKGINVSMPHKERVIEFLGDIDGEGNLCGSVNTLVQYLDGDNRRQFKGFNTDIYGVTKSIEMTGLRIQGSSAAILGLGGAGKAAVVGLSSKEAKSITVFVRNPKENRHELFINRMRDAFPDTEFIVGSYDNEKLLKGIICESNLLINCTSVGMGELEGESLIPDPSFLHNNLTVMDAIYSPAITKLLMQSKEAGCKSFKNGLDMLIYQGAKAFRLFTGEEMPIEIIRNELQK